MKKFSIFHGVLLATIGILVSAFGQEPINPADTSLKKAQDRLPADRPQITATPSQGPVSTSTAETGEAEMMNQMMEMSKLGENHKLLATLAGTWTYTVKFWMNPDPNAKPQESKGTAVRKPLWDGRYFILDIAGKMQVPGPGGKMQEKTFKGMGIEGYDNAQQKFVSAWMDNFGTGIVMAGGAYDSSTKTFNYTGEYEPAPGMKEQFREVVKIIDKDHHTLQWYENRDGKEVKTMQIDYTRKK